MVIFIVRKGFLSFKKKGLVTTQRGIMCLTRQWRGCSKTFFIFIFCNSISSNSITQMTAKFMQLKENDQTVKSWILWLHSSVFSSTAGCKNEHQSHQCVCDGHAVCYPRGSQHFSRTASSSRSECFIFSFSFLTRQHWPLVLLSFRCMAGLSAVWRLELWVRVQEAELLLCSCTDGQAWGVHF